MSAPGDWVDFEYEWDGSLDLENSGQCRDEEQGDTSPLQNNPFSFLKKINLRVLLDKNNPASEKCILKGACPGGNCADYLQRKTKQWRKKGVNSCATKLTKFYCQHSPWRACTLHERYANFVRIATKVLEQRKSAQDEGSPYSGSKEVSQIPINVLPCIAGAETITLEPMLVPLLNCKSKTWRAFGIGQIIPSALKAMAQEDVYYKFKSNIEPYNQSPYIDKKGKSNWKKLYQAMSSSVELQIELEIELLAKKLRRPSVKRAKGEKKIWRAARDYNGSDRKDGYADMVMRCKKCLDKGTQEPWECLKKVRPWLNDIKGPGAVCKGAAP